MFLFIGVFPRERELAVARFHCDRCPPFGSFSQAKSLTAMPRM